uniref:Uncharacterized protein n=1 Tax=Magallana gigas TaxID=29159 RepID=K1QLF6_MAGGI
MSGKVAILFTAAQRNLGLLLALSSGDVQGNPMALMALSGAGGAGGSGVGSMMMRLLNNPYTLCKETEGVKAIPCRTGNIYVQAQFSENMAQNMMMMSLLGNNKGGGGGINPFVMMSLLGNSGGAKMDKLMMLSLLNGGGGGSQSSTAAQG